MGHYDQKSESNIPPTDKSGPTAYTIKEAAAILHMSEKSVRRQIDKGNLRKCKVFGRVLIPRKDVDTFMEKFSSFAV